MIIITSPPGEFYYSMISLLADGFCKAGIAALYSNKNLDENRFNDFIKNSQTQAVLQINKPLLDRGNWNKDVRHLLWLQDYRFNGENISNYLGDSDWFYFLIHPQAFNLDMKKQQNWSVLSPGCITTHGKPYRFFDMSASKYECDLSIGGFIPEPIVYSAPFIEMPDKSFLSMSEFLDGFPMEVLRQSQFNLQAIHNAVRERCETLGCATLSEDKLQDIDEILPRTLERERLVDMAISISQSLKIYGPETWSTWDKFSPYYKGYISDPNDMRKVFKYSKVNMHNSGLGMHFRVLDCFAAGGAMLINRTPLDNLQGGILKSFEAGVHFEHYDFDNFSETAKKLLADRKKRKLIAKAAQEEVNENHSWYKRALQIIKENNLETEKIPKSISSEMMIKWRQVEVDV